MKSIFLTFFITLFNLCASAQSALKHDRIGSFEDLRLEFISNYQPDADSAQNNCWEGCVFVRFKITKQHQLTQVAFTSITPPFIKDAIEKVITNINKRQVNIPQLETPGKTYLLPLLIANNQGCGFASSWVKDNGQNKLTDKQKLMYERRQGEYHQLSNSVENINSFTDGKSKALDCVILPTIVIPLAMH